MFCFSVRPFTCNSKGRIMLNREEAQELLLSLHPEPQLIQHALATEAILRALAPRFGEDPEIWGLAGLLHDLDYPETQHDHSRHGIEGPERIGDGLPEHALDAIRAHNDMASGVKPTTPLDFALRCGESVTGLIVTAALVRPTGMEGMQVSSLKKKMKDKAFAASVNRDCIRECTNIGLDLDTFLTISIEAMSAIRTELRLK